jgi:hypothetical protein
MATKYTKWPKNRPNGYKMYQQRPLQEPLKFSQIGIFGLKIYHLATLVSALRLNRFITCPCQSDKSEH